MTYAYINSQLSADEVEDRLEHDEKIEDFIPQMYKEGFDMGVFE